MNSGLYNTHQANKNEGAEKPDLLISLLQFDLFTDNGLFPAALVRIPFSDWHTGLSKKGRYKCSDPGYSIIH